MLILDFWMQYEEEGEYIKKRFMLYGDVPEFRLDLDSIPYLHIQNGRITEIRDGNARPFTPRPKNRTGEPFSVEEVLQDVLLRLARNETGVMEPVFVSEVAKTYVDAFHKAIAAHKRRDIPYYIIFDRRFLKLAFATDRFLFYDDSLEMPVMFRTEDGTLVSNNEFAEIGYLETVDAVEEGTEVMLEFKTFPDWDVHEFVADRFPTPLKKDEIPERYNSADNMEEEPDTLPF